MNHFKQTAFLFLALLFGVVFSCHAQNSYQYKKRTPEEKARYFTKKMVEGLKVSEDEEYLLYEMNIKVSKKFDSLKVFVDSLERKERSAAYRSIYAYRDSCMRQILPRKQFLKFLDIEREKWERKKAFQRKNEMKKEEE